MLPPLLEIAPLSYSIDRLCLFPSDGVSCIPCLLSHRPLAASAPRVIALAAHYEKLGELTGGGVEILAREIHLGGVGPVGEP